MTKIPSVLLTVFLMTSVMISGCATKPDIDLTSKENSQALTSTQRSKQLLTHTKWQLRGKIAFIQKTKHEKDRRESASMTWQVNEMQQTQALNLTSYLGVNVFHLQSSANQHLIEVDGKQYHGTNLPYLIYSLTGLPLPTKALKFWLKGLPYKEHDEIEMDNKTQLPLSLLSYDNNMLWKINYSDYQIFEGIFMATKFSIKKDDLLIKIAVKHWSFGD